MTLVESAVRFQQILERAGIDSIVIGGLAVAVWGEPRLTRDVDFKVLAERDGFEPLLSVLGPAYRPLGRDPRETFRDLGFAFLTDPNGVRIDVILADTSFDREAVRRGLDCDLADDASVRICTAEDLIVYKLVSTRPRDHEDARGVVLRQRERLDHAYVERWLREFERALDDSTLLNAFRELTRR